MTAADELTGVRADVAQIMRDLEAEQHRQGWDSQGLMLHAVLRSEDGEYGVGSLELGGNHATLVEFANALVLPENQPTFRRLYQHAPVAHIVTSEVWQHSYISDEERAGRDLADIPGSVEVRMAVGLLGATQLLLRRQRGHQPQLSVAGSGDNTWLQGPMADALAQVSRAARAVHAGTVA